MIEIEGTLISLDLLDKHFCCDLTRCKGVCCIEGDSGAPVTEEEVALLEEIYPVIKADMSESAVAVVEQQGVAYVDEEGDLVTSIVDGRQCVFTYEDEAGCCKCLIEEAHRNGESNFKKPISCYLYPVRLKEYSQYIAVNYDRWDICSDACTLGRELKLPLYKFLKDPLVTRFGEEWYKQLEFVAQNMER